MNGTPISLTRIGKEVYCFKAKDYFEIRYKHRVVGNLLGASVGFPQDFNYKALPAVFTECEVQLLVDKGVAVVVEKPSLFKKPEPGGAAEETQFLEDLKKAEDRRQLDCFVRNIASVQKSRPEATVEDLMEERRKQLEKAPLTNRLIQVPTADHLEAEAVPVPSEPSSSLQYRVFRDLWEKGHTLTPGEKFGGDFLAYPGDPLHFHASSIIICRDSRMPLPDLVTYGRSSVIVNKKCVFVREGAAHELVYETLKWVNPSKRHEDAEGS